MEEVLGLAGCCSHNNLVLNTRRTKEVLRDLQKSRGKQLSGTSIDGDQVEVVTWVLWTVHLEGLSWSQHQPHP